MISNEEIRVPVKDVGLTFAEVPDKLAVYFSLGDCAKGCVDCHSSSDLGVPYDLADGMTIDEMKEVAEKAIQKGANAIIVMGGTNCYSFSLSALRVVLKSLVDIAPVCLFSGSDDFIKIKALAMETGCSWVKVGSYKKELGGLQSRHTNQRYYKKELKTYIDYVKQDYRVVPYWDNITSVFWKKERSGDLKNESLYS